MIPSPRNTFGKHFVYMAMNDGGVNMGKENDPTGLLILAARGDKAAASKVMPMIYEELYRLARDRSKGRRGEDRWKLLSPTELVHEAYLRLMSGEVTIDWRHRSHFFAVAAMVMRRLVIDDVRHNGRMKRGEGWVRVPIEAAESKAVEPQVDALELADALKRLAEYEPRQALIAEWRVFVGLPHDHIAQMLGISERTVQAEWALARIHLARELRGKTR